MSTAYDFDLLCIGSGPAGQRPAVQAAKLGKRVAVVEKRTCVGGTCLDLGTIPSKTFREAVCSLAQGNSPFNRSQAVMELGGGGLQYFLRTVFNYPTLPECYKVAALDAFNKLSR